MFMNDKILIDHFSRNKLAAASLINIKIEIYRKLIATSNSLVDLKNKYSSKNSYINIISTVKINENGHSAILAKLLSFKVNGRYQFLDSFINIVLKQHIIFDHNRLNIRLEDGRIDIFVRDGNSCLIIENKINNALDQHKQLFRYIEYAKNVGYNYENIWILYLKSVESEHYPAQSISIHQKEFQDRITIASFEIDILGWLINNVVTAITPSQNEIYCFVNQYKDYLEKRYTGKIRGSKMRSELKEFIYHDFKLSESEKPSNIKKLREEISSILEIKKIMESILEDQYKAIFQEWKSNLTEKYPSLAVRGYDPSQLLKAGVLVNSEFGLFSILIEKDKDSGIYFGMGKHYTTDKGLNDNIKHHVKGLMNGFKETPWWYGWKRTSFETGYADLCLLIDDYLELKASKQ